MSVTHATITKQNRGETASACVEERDKDARIPIGGEMSSLFINTRLNNMNPDLTKQEVMFSAPQHEYLHK